MPKLRHSSSNSCVLLVALLPKTLLVNSLSLSVSTLLILKGKRSATNFNNALAPLAALEIPDLYTNHSSGSINGDEEISVLALIGHLWQVLDVDMNEADGVVFEALILWLVVLRPRHVSEITDAMPSEASVKSGARDL